MKPAQAESTPTPPSDSSVPLEAVLCTEELDRRPSRPPDCEHENRTLAELVQALADSPQNILQKMAEIMLKSFRAESAGFSLLTKDDGGKRFHWPAIAGLWKPHIGGGTPREFGPCGDVLDRNAPLLFKHWERRYPYLKATTPPIEEGLLVPFYVEGKAVGTIWVIAHNGGRKFDAEDLRQLVSLGKFASAAYQSVASQGMVAMNEALVLGSLRQHELTEAAESLNEQIKMEVAARAKTAQELAKTAQELSEKARLIDLSNDAIIVRDLENKIRLWNMGAEKLFGWTFEEVMGKDLHSLLHTEFPKPIEEIIAHLHREGRFNGEVVQIARDGRRVRSLCGWVLDRDTESIFTSYTDITERTKAEEALRQAQAELADRAMQLDGLITERTGELRATNKQLEVFVYSIAHDLRAPLRSMQGFSEMLLEEAGPALSETARDFASRINKSAQFMDALLQDLLAFSRIAQQRIELTSVNLEPVVRSTLTRLEEEIQQKNVRMDVVGPWPSVLVFEPMLGQVIFNLVSNAMKFTRPGAPAHIRLRAEEGPAKEGVDGLVDTQPEPINGLMDKWISEPSSPNPLEQRSTQPREPAAGFVRVWVEDNGIGIAPDHQQQIFRLFTRLHGGKFPGTGVGLAIVTKGIERMGGTVGVESTPGEGSRFWFELRKAANPG